jgi:hypothetical protein
MAPSPEPTTLDSALKAVQIAFYVIGSTIAVLTYRAAKRGLFKRLSDLLHPLLSDPFIPAHIREAVVDLVKNRLEVMTGIYLREFERYADRLAKGKQTPITELDDVNKVHNRIVEQMRKQGCGITQIEAEVHRIRGLIQDYFESFNPHQHWWQHRKRRRAETIADE